MAAMGAAFSFDGCSRHSPAPGPLTNAEVERMATVMTGVTLKPPQVAGVREMLATMRFKGSVDPSIQPSLLFDPEVDVER